MTAPNAERSASGSEQLAAWLTSQKLSLAFTTYRANRLLFLGTSESDSAGTSTLKLHERLFDRPMGLYADGDSLWMAGRCQLWRLDNHLGPGQSHEGGDRLYVPAACFITGDVNAHELVISGGGQLLFVNTAFSCLATIEPGSSFAPTWQPPFITQLAADDRCHLNGLALRNGEATWASACGNSDSASSWRTNRASGGVLIHIPSGELAATGLAMPHSPRWYEGRLWLLNSGTGALGWIENSSFHPLCTLPGFARGLAFAGGYAVVGLSKLRSPQFTGLPLEERLAAEGIPGGCCGLRVIDLASGKVLHSLDLPEPIDELFDVVVLPGVRQPRALGLQGEAIDCLVKLSGQSALVQVRPMAPRGNRHQGAEIEPFGLPKRATAAVGTPIHYQRVFHLTPSNLAPYAALTFPALNRDITASQQVTGELLGLSAMADGVMVGLAIAEVMANGGARLLSLMVEPTWRQRGIGRGVLDRLMAMLAKENISTLTVHYPSSELTRSAFEPILKRLGWSPPRTEALLLEARSDRLAAATWAEQHPIRDPYRVIPWAEISTTHWQQASLSELPAELRPQADSPAIEPAISLGLVHHNRLVGWLVVERTSSDHVSYSSFFVEPGHRGRARGVALLAAGFQLQHAAGITTAHATIHTKQPEMLRLLKRHLSPLLNAVGSGRSSQTALRQQSRSKRPIQA